VRLAVRAPTSPTSTTPPAPGSSDVVGSDRTPSRSARETGNGSTAPVTRSWSPRTTTPSGCSPALAPSSPT
jgi:hypothetical protein